MAKLICVFVFEYAKSRFSHDVAHIMIGQRCKITTRLQQTSKSELETVVHKYISKELKNSFIPLYLLISKEYDILKLSLYISQFVPKAFHSDDSHCTEKGVSLDTYTKCPYWG